MKIMRSIVLSVVVSVIGTYLLQQLVLRAEGRRDPEEQAGDTRPGSSNVNVNVFVMPIAIGNVAGVAGPRVLKGLKHGMRHGMKHGMRHGMRKWRG